VRPAQLRLFTRQIYWSGEKVNGGRFPNLAQIARDILAVQGGRVGVERVLSMTKAVIPYRHSPLKSSTIGS